MSAQTCPMDLCGDETRALLQRAVASHIEALRQERLRAFASIGASQKRTNLERSVDELLDSLSTLHRLEQLAAHVARGGHISVEADRLLIAANEETYRQLLEEYAARNASGPIVYSGLMPSVPTPLD